MSDQKDLLRRALATIDDLERRARDAEARLREPIAVVGMSCRFPGGVTSPDEYWDLLREGRSGIGEIPGERWDVDAFYDPELSRPGTMYTKHGGFVDGLDGFDAPFFRISPREAATLDPQHRLLLECAWQALEDAGEAPDRLVGSDTGVFVGITTSDYARLLRIGREDSDVYSATGTALNGAAGRISFFLGLQGPCMSIDTACSSSLVAAHSACQALRAGECDRALVGGVNTILSPEPFVLFSRWGMISPTGTCRAFDDDADGFVRGEGCGVLVLKRLSDARAAGDRIHAVVLGSAVTQDGASSGLSVPNGPAQVKAIRAALHRAGVAPAEVGFVETHGTGTPIGDPIELEALGEAYAEGRSPHDPLRIASVKTSIGHLESAAGVAGLMKLVLAVREGALPPQREFTRPSTRIDWDHLPLRVVDGLEPWAPQRRRVGAVSGFGFTGTNVHMVVAAPPGPPSGAEGAEVDTGAARVPWLLPLSGRSPAAVREGAGRLARVLSGASAPDPADVARTLVSGRATLPERAAVVGADRAALVEGLRALSEDRVAAGVCTGASEGSRPRPVAFMYSGQGSQYPGMGRALRAAFPVFRAAFDRCAEILRDVGGPDLHGVLQGDDPDRIHATEVTQPTLFALEYALTELLGSWGVRPGVVLGHSVGEYVAAHVAGVFDLEDALRLVTVRGRLMGALPAGGGMLAVAADVATASEAAAPFADRVSLAARNGPESMVLSGELEALERIAAGLEDRGIETRRLTVSHAFHSPLMEPMQDAWAEALSRIRLRPPTTPLVSNLSGTLDPGAGASPEYWIRHVREAVAFEPSMRALVEGGYRVFVEVGPRPVLLGMARRFIDLPDAAWIPTLRARDDEPRDVLEGLGGLFAAGLRPEWEALLEGRGRRIGLPTYAFQRSRHWAAARPTPPGQAPRRGADDAGTAPLHPLLGRLVRSPVEALQFECTLDPISAPLLAEHRVAGQAVVPASGYMELARAAGERRWGTPGIRLEAGRFRSALVLDGAAPGGTDVRLVLSPTAPDRAEFSLSSRSATAPATEPWTRHAGGRIAPATSSAGPATETEEEIRARCDEEVDIEAYRAAMREVGLDYGPSFQALVEARRTEGEALGVLRLPPTAATEGFGVHPGLLDAVFHLIGLAHSEPEGRFLLPAAFGAVEFHGAAGAEVRAHCVVRHAGPTRVVADLAVRRADGTLVARIEGLETRPVTREQFQEVLGGPAPSILLTVAWQPLDPPAGEAGEAAHAEAPWLVVHDAPEAATPLVEALSARGVAARAVAGSEFPALLASRTDPLDERVAGIVDLRAAAPFPAETPGGRAADGLATVPSAEASDGRVGACLAALREVAARPPRTGLPIVLVTRGAQAVRPDDPVDPVTAILWGIGASADAELPTCRVRLVDIGDAVGDVPALAAVVAGVHDDDRLAIRDGGVFAARAVRDLDGGDPPPRRPYALGIEARGDLSGLAFRPAQRTAPGPGQVEIEVLASGLNFRDVLNLLDMYPGEVGDPGNECCGRVVAVGDDVHGVAVGDLVTCIAENTFGSHVRAEASMVFPVPAELSAAQAAAFPIAHLTAWLALHRIGGIEAGDRVLIHAAAGGVGLAAVHLARAAGAHVLGTAGSDEKREYLRSIGVSHVFDSRTTLPSDAVLAATGGHGVDLVLNSLTGDAIDEGIRSLAPGGRFLEIGLRELRTEAEVAALRDDVVYSSMVLGEWCRREPLAVREMWRDLVELLESRRIPAPRVRTFPLARVEDAFRFMARAHHVGRIAVVHPGPPTPALRGDAAYLVTGGLGALGLHVAEWLADRGAGTLVLLGRSAPSEAASARIEALRERGVTVRVEAGDVARADAWRFVDDVAAPIRGVVHAAGVSDDATLARVDGERLTRLLRPKADGATRLVEAVEGAAPDFVLFFSSGSALLGSAGQAAYAGANAFLDAYARHLRSSGIPATSIGWGAWAGDGMAGAVDDRTLRQWADRGIGVLSVDEARAVLDAALGRPCPYIAALPIDWPTFLGGLDRVPGLLAGLAGDGASGGSPGGERGSADAEGLADHLGTLPPRERRGALTEWLRGEVAAVLGLSDTNDVQARRGFAEQGMDSLMAVELSAQLGRRTGVALHSTFLFDHPTLEALAAFLAESMGIDAGATGDGDLGGADDAFSGLDDLSEAELEAELRRALDEGDG